MSENQAAPRTVGVVGAGVMGVGVAQNLAQTGHRVILLDVSDEVLARARAEIEKGLRFHGMFTKQKTAGPAPAEVLARIDFTTSYDGFAAADFVIENVTEKWELKSPVYPVLDRVCPPHACFAANTSAYSITRIGSLTQRADRVLGMHFMNPVPLKPTVEVIRAFHTSQATIDTAQALLGAMGKEGIVVNDMPGFVSNRVLMLTINEAVWLVQDQVAAAEDVDRIFKTCFGHRMGPLETADLIGLDTILYSVEVLYESYNDSKYRPCPLLKKMVDAGLHGRKNGRGFYDYGV
ncbi:3-hydroxyacyl-CoA dehydrogenase family protein [Longimicrobium sp.]|uniref:3-hydroxyacyl-CoA dehydrogenase family protein n=1 Tax=Longimicrobium sp. TaxID=2029185 RepID=UPI002C3AA06A|nr:3-hydroxyacyl-CoA dehydrogenase NAD-binding domain-containing protein [Longimicrobium sp.]HSU14486.1 3-hydroxyacyl-CoA dehydrogenase NAD-binding domain-containing protein [Longimicrobium sp.]